MIGPEQLRPDEHEPSELEETVETEESHGRPKVASWTFMTNHAHVLFCLARDPAVRLREVASMVGITERAVQRIVHDLQEGGYIDVHKEGRRNRYSINTDLPLRHPVENHRRVDGLLDFVFGDR